LGLLELAAQSGLVDFTEAAERLRLTTFRSPELCSQPCSGNTGGLAMMANK